MAKSTSGCRAPPYGHVSQHLCISTLIFLLVAGIQLAGSQSLLSSLPFHTASGLASRSQHASRILSLSTSSSAQNVITKESCRRIVGLSPKQRRWCRRNYQLLPAIGDGAKLGLVECQRRFESRRWNCPITKPTIFSKILGAESKETAYVHSIQSAGITLAIARACSRGQAGKRCGCASDKTGESKSHSRGNFTWGSCSDNIQDGARYGREFLSSNEDGNSPSSLMSLHDSETGRQIVSDNMVLVCKCHGLTGTCAQRTCWYSLPKIHVVGTSLLKKYDQSIRVRPDTRQRKLIPEEFNRPMPEKDDLVYLRSSPDYCHSDRSKGSLGTSGRQCAISPQTGNSTQASCDSMCCGRGYNVRRRVIREKCSCRFQWCCKVKCKECRVVKQTFACL